MTYGVNVVTKPAEFCVTLNEVKSWLRLESEDIFDDADAMATMEAATDLIEARTGRALITQTVDFTFDAFPASDREPILLPRTPAQSLTSVTYIDSDGNSQSWTDTQTDFFRQPARILPAFDTSYPATRDVMNAVTVRAVVGYGLKSDVPEALKQAVKLLAAHWFNHREAVIVGTNAMDIPTGVEALIAPFKLGGFA